MVFGFNVWDNANNVGNVVVLLLLFTDDDATNYDVRTGECQTEDFFSLSWEIVLV